MMNGARSQVNGRETDVLSQPRQGLNPTAIKDRFINAVMNF